MDAMYYLSGGLMTILLLGLLVSTLAFLVKPHLLNDRKIIKNPFSRKKILLVGVLAIAGTMVGFGPVLAATEPADIKAARIERERAAQEAKQKTQNTPVETTKKEEPKPVVKEETSTEVVPFTSKEQELSTLAKGEKKITTTGVNGEKTLYYEVTYLDNKETSRVLKKEVITKEPVTQITSIGTYVAPAPKPKKSTAPTSNESSCNPNYSGCVPNVSYDLDCPDIGKKVRVIGRDQYRLDRDGDGWGCESY